MSGKNHVKMIESHVKTKYVKVNESSGKKRTYTTYENVKIKT